MILTADQSIAIEAKYTEPPYQSVNKWLGLEPTENRTKVLCGWLDEISKVTGRAITLEEVGPLPYQLIHRTASVCCAPGRLRTVVYQVFGQESSDYYIDSLRKLVACVGVGPPIQFWVHACAYVPTDAWQPCNDTRESTESAKSVRVALLADTGVLPAGTFTRITD
jgi:hypothetical protein